MYVSGSVLNPLRAAVPVRAAKKHKTHARHVIPNKNTEVVFILLCAVNQICLLGSTVPRRKQTRTVESPESEQNNPKKCASKPIPTSQANPPHDECTCMSHFIKHSSESLQRWPRRFLPVDEAL